jgi:hypothetical protein
MLVPIEHPVRADIRRAARVCRELGANEIGVESLRPRNRAEAEYVISQLVPGAESTVRYERGPLALDELAAVVLPDDSYGMCSHARLGDAHISLWRDQARVYVTDLPAGGLEAAKELVAAAGIAAADVTFNGPHSKIDVNTPDRAAGYRLFRAAATPGYVYVSISNLGPTAIARFPALLAALDTQVTINATLHNDIAATVSERVPCDRWQIEDLLYDPEAQLLYTYGVYPVPDAQVSAWRAKLDAALTRAA